MRFIGIPARKFSGSTGATGIPWICRRLLHRSDLGFASASASEGQERRGACGSEFAVICRRIPGIGCALSPGPSRASQSAANFSIRRNGDVHRRNLRHLAAAGLLAAIRFVGVTHTIYRIKVLGRDNIPERGGALFICNHLSHVDALLLMSSTDRKVRFLMYKGIYEKPAIKPFARILDVIPISSEQRPREMIQSLREASEAIKEGQVVCIFPEGQITRIGFMLPFQRGFERIMKDVDAPIIPIALDGVWGSIFSFEKGRFLWKFPRQIPYPVTVNFGKPLPPTASPFEVRQAVQELMVEAWRERKPRMKPLHQEFVHTARLHPFRFAMADGLTTRVSFGAALIKTIFLARRLRKVKALTGLNELNRHQLSESKNPKGIPPQSPGLRGTSYPGIGVQIHNPEGVAPDSHGSVPGEGEHRQMVGLLLPPSVGGALANFAVMLMGKVPVNLNYTVSEETLTSCIRQCEIQTVDKFKSIPGKSEVEGSGANSVSGGLEREAGIGRKNCGVSECLAADWLVGKVIRARRERGSG